MHTLSDFLRFKTNSTITPCRDEYTPIPMPNIRDKPRLERLRNNQETPSGFPNPYAPVSFLTNKEKHDSATIFRKQESQEAPYMPLLAKSMPAASLRPTEPTPGERLEKIRQQESLPGLRKLDNSLSPCNSSLRIRNSNPSRGTSASVKIEDDLSLHKQNRTTMIKSKQTRVKYTMNNICQAPDQKSILIRASKPQGIFTNHSFESKMTPY